MNPAFPDLSGQTVTSGSGAFGMLPVLGALLVLSLAPAYFYRPKFIGKGGLGFFLLGLVLAVVAVVVRCNDLGVLDGRIPVEFRDGGKPQLVLSVAMAGLTAMLIVPLLIRMYRKWTGTLLTDRERLAGVEGVRAWLGGGNLVLAAMIALAGWVGLGYSFWAILALAVGLLLAYPVFNLIARPDRPQPAAAQAPVDLSGQRERVLKLLEDGKITAEEGAELLNALADSARPSQPGPHVTTTKGRKLALVGAAAVLVGFFLPWFSVNLGQEMSRLSAMQRPLSGLPSLNGSGAPQMPVEIRGTHSVSGGDVKNGLGWIVLLLAVAAAVMPYVAAGVKPQLAWTLSLVGLAGGGVILLYLLTQGMRYVSVGLIVALAGYVLEFMGVGMDRRQAA